MIGIRLWRESSSLGNKVSIEQRSEISGFTLRRRIGFRMELIQGAAPICKGSCRLTSLERQEVWNDCRSCKVRVGSNGNLLWEASVLLGRKKGGGMHGDDVVKTIFRMCNGHVKVYGYAFWVNQCTNDFYGVNEPVVGGGAYVKMIVESLKEDKMYVKFSNNVEAEQRGSYLDVEGIKWHSMIALVKVRWDSMRGPELTWERKDQMRPRELKRNGNVMVIEPSSKSRDDIPKGEGDTVTTDELITFLVKP
ncbi:hypothetical protein Tco_0537129 [Tanacetum coccineum]